MFRLFWGRDLFLRSIVYKYWMPEIALEENLGQTHRSGDVSAPSSSFWPSSAGYQLLSHGLYAKHCANCIVCVVIEFLIISGQPFLFSIYRERKDPNRFSNDILGTKPSGDIQHPNCDTKQNRISLTMLCGSCLAPLPIRNISVLLKVRSPTVWTALIVANLVKFYLPVF